MNSPDEQFQCHGDAARWPGVIFSLLVPGFGLLRAGLVRRGVIWFSGIQLGGVLLALVFAAEAIPIQLAFVAVAAAVIVQIWMWCDSFRPGRMTISLWMVFLTVIIAISLLPPLGRLVGKAFKIPTGSMQPTLKGIVDGGVSDHVIVNRLSYFASHPKRGDLIVFSTSSIRGISKASPVSSEENYYVMRVIGLPDERIQIRGGAVFADGVKLGEKDGVPPIKYSNFPNQPTSAKRDGDAFLVEGAEYFVLGDNTDNSYDSRFWGCVPESCVFGKVTKIYYPFSRLGEPRFSAGNKD